MFRPHPRYYFFMHGELRAMLTEARSDAYLDALATGQDRPALIALDDELRPSARGSCSSSSSNYVSDDGLFLPARRVRRRRRSA